MPKIETIYAFITEKDAPDSEYICPVVTLNGVHPMVCTDQRRLDDLRPRAADLADMRGKPVKVCVFRLEEVKEVLVPRPPTEW